jgi:hypothetical protein
VFLNDLEDYLKNLAGWSVTPLSEGKMFMNE